MHGGAVCDFDEVFVRHFSPSFQSYADLTKTLKEFEMETGTFFCIRSCKRKPDDDTLVYSSIFYWCSRSNSRKSTSLGFRHTRPVLKPRKVHCGARFSVVMCGDVLRISSFNMRHNHHPTKNWNHGWGGVHDRLKHSGIQQVRSNSRCAVSMDQFKKLMRRELDFRFPSRPKRSQSEVDEYRFHCLSSTLPKLIRSYRQFEAGVKNKYPDKLLNKLDLVIKHYLDEIKAYSVGGPTCQLSPAGRLVAAAVQEIVCALCCSFAYCDLLLCKLCSWRAHSKCATRLGISSCPRCPIESNLMRIDRPLGWTVMADDLEVPQKNTLQGRCFGGETAINPDKFILIDSPENQTDLQLNNFENVGPDACHSIDIRTESVKSDLADSITSGNTLPCVFSSESDVASDCDDNDTIDFDQISSNLSSHWTSTSQSATRFKPTLLSAADYTQRFAARSDSGTLRRLLTSAPCNKGVHLIKVPRGSRSSDESRSHYAEVLPTSPRSSTTVFANLPQRFSGKHFRSDCQFSHSTVPPDETTSSLSNSARTNPKCPFGVDRFESCHSVAIPEPVSPDKCELLNRQSRHSSRPIPPSSERSTYVKPHTLPGHHRFVVPVSLAKSLHKPDIKQPQVTSSSNYGTLRDLLTDKNPLWTLGSAMYRPLDFNANPNSATVNIKSNDVARQTSESSRAAGVLISLLDARGTASNDSGD
ncbi:hypothetical protein D915_000456 [Fasciola hepatica]|uniref:Uncharacterized protein n=1 Tax=Fasciola hepatica TaxID=6192 RepID=A0A4E0RRP7_FASHE|nr:hypothetical protein D915_000456 [Fasciola hepatica]